MLFHNIIPNLRSMVERFIRLQRQLDCRSCSVKTLDIARNFEPASEIFVAIAERKVDDNPVDEVTFATMSCRTRTSRENNSGVATREDAS